MKQLEKIIALSCCGLVGCNSDMPTQNEDPNKKVLDEIFRLSREMEEIKNSRFKNYTLYEVIRERNIINQDLNTKNNLKKFIKEKIKGIEQGKNYYNMLVCYRSSTYLPTYEHTLGQYGITADAVEEFDQYVKEFFEFSKLENEFKKPGDNKEEQE